MQGRATATPVTGLLLARDVKIKQLGEKVTQKTSTLLKASFPACLSSNTFQAHRQFFLAQLHRCWIPQREKERQLKSVLCTGGTLWGTDRPMVATAAHLQWHVSAVQWPRTLWRPRTPCRHLLYHRQWQPGRKKKDKKKERNGNVASLSSFSLSLLKPWLPPLFAEVSTSKELYTHRSWFKQPLPTPPSAQQHSEPCLASAPRALNARSNSPVNLCLFCNEVLHLIYAACVDTHHPSNTNPFIFRKLILI